jgi:hypothetical protein
MRLVGFIIRNFGTSQKSYLTNILNSFTPECHYNYVFFILVFILPFFLCCVDNCAILRTFHLKTRSKYLTKI